MSAMNGRQFSVDLWGNLKFTVMHVSPQSMLFCMQCHGPSPVHAELRRTADIMESVRCVSSQTSSVRGLDGLGRRGGGFSAPAVIQLCYTAASPPAAASSSSSADQRPAAGSHCNTGDVVKPAAGLNTLLSRQSLQRAGPQSFPEYTATGRPTTGQSELM
ncbi:hypothetical protein ABVT39_004795 [Epinephelus coioides]